MPRKTVDTEIELGPSPQDSAEHLQAGRTPHQAPIELTMKSGQDSIVFLQSAVLTRLGDPTKRTEFSSLGVVSPKMDKLVESLESNARTENLSPELFTSIKVLKTEYSKHEIVIGDKKYSIKPELSFDDLAQLFDSALTQAGVDEAVRKEAFGLFSKALNKDNILALNKSELSANQSEIDLPNEAPELYQGLRGPETPPEFVKRVYAPWLGQGLDRAHIRKLDQALSTAINNWLSRPGNEWPSDVDLPTRKQQNDRAIERLQEGVPANLTLRDARRIEGAIQRRRETERK